MNSIITVKCPDPTHREFTQTAQNLLRFQGCRSCKESVGERLVRLTLESLDVEFEQEKRFPTCRDKKELPFDFWLPHHATLIEFQGMQHEVAAERFGGIAALASIKKRDLIKRRWAEANGLRLIYVSDYGAIKSEILRGLPTADNFRPVEILERLSRKNSEWVSNKWRIYLSRLNQRHRGRYDFSISSWDWGQRQIDYLCPVHGKRTGNLFHLLKGHGCSLCAGNEVSISEVIARSRAKFGEGFGFSPDTFTGMDEDTEITCPVHGKTLITPNTHLRLSKGCRRCSVKAEDRSPEKFLVKATELFLDWFDYSNISYTGATKKVKIKCNKHELEFLTLPSDHLRSRVGACPACASEKKSQTKSKPIEIRGVVFPSMILACKHYGIDRSVVTARITKGWDVDRAFTTPKLDR